MGIEQLSEPVKHGLDLISFGALLTTIVGLLPPIGAALSVFWIALRVRTALLEHRIREQEYQLNARKLRGDGDSK
jgi:uncharacterized membrane protein YciS (DUF1049 family)